MPKMKLNCKLIELADTPSKLKALAIFLLPLVTIYFFLYYANVSVITRESRRTSTMRLQETENVLVTLQKDRSSDKLNIDKENIRDVLGKLSNDMENLKLRLRQLEKNTGVYENKTEDLKPGQINMSETLLTLFSTWTRNDEMSTIQKNTLKNWASFKPVINPVIFTNDTILAKEAETSGWTVRNISKTAENGLPVLKYMYIDAIKSSDSIFYGYANSDILFDGGLIKTLVNLVYTLQKDISFRPLFLTGLRWNVINVTENDISRRKNISGLVKKKGQVFVTSAQDYFITNRIYPWKDIPEVVVGAIAYDNWLVANAREKKHFTINTSRTILALHQSIDVNQHRSHFRDTVNYNANLLQNIYKINLPYHKGFLECIERYTDFVNDTFVLGERMVSQYCN